MTDHAVLQDMRASRPQLRLLTEPAEMADYRHDETDFVPYGQPLAVAFPTSTEDVSAVVRACAHHRVPVVARGGGSGLSGGANAMDGWIVLSMSGMDRIIEIDAANLLVVTQPGVITADLEAAVEAEGLMYPPDPASHELSFIGGNIAENAGGLRCVKYGVTRDYVLGLEVVLADGEVIRTGGRNVKDVMGYDLTRLMVGSEGTLGIITEATLKLRPKPAPKTTLLAFFPSVGHAGDAVSRMTAAGVIPVTLEMLDRNIIDAVEGALHLGLDPAAGAMLMIESDAGGQLAAGRARHRGRSLPGCRRDVDRPGHEPRGGRRHARSAAPGALVVEAAGAGSDGGHQRAAQSRRGADRRDRADLAAARHDDRRLRTRR